MLQDAHARHSRGKRQSRTWLGADSKVVAQQDGAAGDDQEALRADGHACGAPLASALGQPLKRGRNTIHVSTWELYAKWDVPGELPVKHLQ